MKKLLLTVFLLGAFSLTTLPSYSSAQTVDFEDLYYPSHSEKGKYFALDFWSYLTGYKSITRNDFTHMKLTDGKTYDFFDYLVAYPEHKNLEKALQKVVSEGNSLTGFNVTSGKIAKDGTIMDAALTDNTVAPTPVVKEFKVIDIK